MTEARSSATWLWAGVAGILIVGFMVWLTLTSEPSVVAEVQEDTTEEVAPAAPPPAPEPVTAQAFEASPESYAGREVELVDVVVASKTGPQILWIELPGGGTFPVKTDPEAAAGVAPQTRVTVLGRVDAKTDATLAAWAEQGVLEDDAQRTQAAAGSYFIEATAIRPAGESEE